MTARRDLPPLPIDESLDEIEARLESHRALVLIAQPGAGKSTRVPPRLVLLGRTILLQPRRVAARSIARRIAEEQGWTIGREVGWHVRADRKESRDTRLLVATEGMLTARLQTDPLASAFTTIILDEFHERSVHTDLAVALAREAWRAREDLRLVVMSATLNAGSISRFLDDAPVMEVSGRTHPIEVRHEPDSGIPEVLRRNLGSGSGHTLVFLPGAAEIERVRSEIVESGVVAAESVFRLHGSLDGAEQDRAIAPSATRRVILSTNVAETSITIDGVDLVIDSGYHKVLRFDADRGIDRLSTERIPRDSADQRAGRAGRTGPGRAIRLCDARQILEARREPDIQRVDLAGPALDVFAWGTDPDTFAWFERPPAARLGAAIELLERLGFVRDRRITTEGRQARRMPVHPRVARFVDAAGGGARALTIAAALSEGMRVSASGRSSDSDLFMLEDQAGQDRRIERVAGELARLIGNERGAAEDDDALLRAALSGWPDRIAMRRPASRERYQLSSGGGAVLSKESSVRDAQWMVAVDLGSATVDGAPTALIRMASRIEPHWLTPTANRLVHEEVNDELVAHEEVLYGELVLRRARRSPSVEELENWRRVKIAESADAGLIQLLRRIRFARVDFDLISLAAEVGQTDAERLTRLLPHAVRTRLEAAAPARLRVPSGRDRTLSYRDDGGVELEVKLQELFGMVDTPRIGPDRTPITIVMLSPAGRPVQTTRDLRSFWETTYFEVRRELRGRYPRHPWPENPLEAEPTSRTKRR